METLRILVINTGSTSTKIAVYDSDTEVFVDTLRHPNEECEKYSHVIDEYPLRIEAIYNVLNEKKVPLQSIDIVVGRGGILKPIHGGVWKVTPAMLEDLKDLRTAQHASNLSGIIAYEISKVRGIKSYVVDPVVVDEMDPVAKISGIPQIERRSIFHALNQKASARKAAQELGKRYEDVNLIVAHLGGGITVGAHKKGRVVDVNNGLDGDGPFAPERAGGLPAGQLVDLCFHGNLDEETIKRLLKGRGGLVAYCGTSDTREAADMAAAGDKKAELVLKAMAYQVAKEIGAMAAVLEGKIDGLVITGGIANYKEFVSWITEKISSLGRLFIYPGENEMEALRDGALRVSRGQEEAHEYA